jgi:hypothetical protein
MAKRIQIQFGAFDYWRFIQGLYLFYGVFVYNKIDRTIIEAALIAEKSIGGEASVFVCFPDSDTRDVSCKAPPRLELRLIYLETFRTKPYKSTPIRGKCNILAYSPASSALPRQSDRQCNV